MDFGAVQRLWPDVVEAVKQKSRATWMVIMSGVQPVSLDGKVLTLGFDAEGRRLGFVNGGRDAVLREVFKERMGVEWRIETVVGGAPAGPPSGRPGPSSGFGGAATPNPAPQPRSPARPAAQPSAPGPERFERPERAERVPEPPPPPDEPPPPPDPGPLDESDEVDPEGDADADGIEAEMNGMALIERELGGRIIREIDNS
ncbi:hypothetical protein LUW74_37415 [Actinomadura madurae]|uniref:hypothetical protein n=1 Tax=Actinomadura madurae TaxID=1993 RepID=UPI002026DCB0|nr:hypothetical protein [Actinomadura madurae]URN08495.1 hypothetical protein LUW74_37415 [Actinomadura madurae]